MSGEDQDYVWSRGSRERLSCMGLDDLVALGEALERRVTRGTATLDDFGALARTRHELVRRARDGRSDRERRP